MPAPHSSLNSQLCPRCDYDLSGQSATWRDECPLHGLCSECGLGFHWQEVLNPSFVIAPWSFEHAKSSSTSGVVPLLRTLIRLPFPGCLWRGVPLAAPVLLVRAAFIGLCGVGILHTLAMILFLLLTAVVGAQGGALRGTAVPLVQSFMDHLGFAISSRPWYFPYAVPAQSYRLAYMPGCLILGFLVLIPTGFLCLPFTMRRLRVRLRHILRLACYSLFLVPLLCFIPALGALLNQIGWALSPSGNFWNANPDSWFDQLLLHTHHIVLALVLLIPTVWWARSIAVYLRVPRPWFVAILLTVMASLGILAIAYVSPPFSWDVPHMLHELFT